jgi:hypothetical protein
MGGGSVVSPAGGMERCAHCKADLSTGCDSDQVPCDHSHSSDKAPNGDLLCAAQPQSLFSEE